MKHRSLALPTLASIALTRAMLGAGAGLLLSSRLPARQRQILGMALLGVGIASTIPLAAIVLGSRSR
jgi:NO-binding membrane sensor protein with MHYT domain